MTFEDLELHPLILKALADINYSNPTTVQEQAIPAALDGKDLLVSSQTGSGKTAAFILPMLNKFANSASVPNEKTPNQQKQSAKARGERARSKPAQPKLLVLAPTRELAIQVTNSAEQYSAHMRRIKTTAILGGMPYPKQLQLLARNPEILVATPGRLIDHMESGKIDFSQLEVLVLDEADRMLDMGFIEDIETIVDATPDTRQTMLFSATLDGVVGSMAQRITRDPTVIQVSSASTKHENITQLIHFADDLPHKNRLLDYLLRDTTIDQALVFTATKRDADLLADRLSIAGFSAAALHGDMSQGARNRTLNGLRRGHIKILVATDVAARGIDVPTITHVINYDLPKFPEDYIHRIGRTGRAGRDGLAISLVNHIEAHHIRRIERLMKQTIPINEVEGLEPKRKPAPSNAKKRKANGWKPGGKRPNGNDKTASQRTFSKPDSSGSPKKSNGQKPRRPSSDRRASA